VGDALDALRRLQAAQRRAQRSARTATGPQEALVLPFPVVRADGDADGPETAATGHERLRLVVSLSGPEDLVALTDRERAALAAVGLVVQLEDGRAVVLGVPDGTAFEWPLGVLDAAGRPLPYLRGGEPVVPFAAADEWKWWRGGLDPDAVRAQLVAHGGDLEEV